MRSFVCVLGFGPARDSDELNDTHVMKSFAVVKLLEKDPVQVMTRVQSNPLITGLIFKSH